MGPFWGPPRSCRPQMGPMLAPWTLLSRILHYWDAFAACRTAFTHRAYKNSLYERLKVKCLYFHNINGVAFSIVCHWYILNQGNWQAITKDIKWWQVNNALCLTLLNSLYWFPKAHEEFIHGINLLTHALTHWLLGVSDFLSLNAFLRQLTVGSI